MRPPLLRVINNVICAVSEHTAWNIRLQSLRACENLRWNVIICIRRLQSPGSQRSPGSRPARRGRRRRRPSQTRQAVSSCRSARTPVARRPPPAPRLGSPPPMRTCFSTAAHRRGNPRPSRCLQGGAPTDHHIHACSMLRNMIDQPHLGLLCMSCSHQSSENHLHIL